MEVVNPSLLLYGTDEAIEPMRRLVAGRLSLSLDRGNLRYIDWGGVEILRAISFVVRDSKWGTYAPQLDELVVDAKPDGFEVRYAASCDGPEGDFHFEVIIAGKASGSLSFVATGRSTRGFETCRTGFVVLHGLDGLPGKEVTVEHPDGAIERSSFPDLIDPDPPITDIRALTHEARDGLTVAVHMEGDAYEMEDQRNWTDASYKTYIRPLSRGYPYHLAAGEQVEQSVTVVVSDRRSSTTSAKTAMRSVRIGAADGVVPTVGLALESALDPTSRATVLAVRPNYLVARLDSRVPTTVDKLRALGDLCRKSGTALDLDIVVPALDPDAELSAVAALINAAALDPNRILIVPTRDLHKREPRHVPNGEADLVKLLSCARRAFPDRRIGGGTPIGFPEFNRNPPALGVDFIAHSTQANVHAADDISVMETLNTIADVVRSGRSIAPDTSYRLGPGTIAAPAAFYAVPPAANPDNIRKPTADTDPRQRGLFAAAFGYGYFAAAGKAGVDSVTLALAEALGDETGSYPLAPLLSALASLAGCRALKTTTNGSGFAAMAVAASGGTELWLSNLTAEPVAICVQECEIASERRLDATGTWQAIHGGAPTIPHSASVVLDAYAIHRMRIR